MDENGKALIRDLIKGGLGRNEIKEEMVNAGYDYSDIEKELDFAYLISGVGAQDSANLYATQNIAPPPSVAVNPTASAAQKPAAAKKSYTIAIVVFLIIALGAGFYAYNAGMFGAQNIGDNQNISAAGGNGGAPNQSQKAETGLLDKITKIGNKALVSEEELKKLNETCAQKLGVYTQKKAMYSEKYDAYVRASGSARDELRKSLLDINISAAEADVNECYAKYSVNAKDYSICKSAISEASCRTKVPSIDGNASVCDNAVLDRKIATDMEYKIECYTNAAKYHSDPSYCEKISIPAEFADAAGSIKAGCILSIVNKENYKTLCSSIRSCKYCESSYGECFAKVAQETKNHAVCDEADALNYVCYMTLAISTHDRSLCDKASAYKDMCLKSVKTIAE